MHFQKKGSSDFFGFNHFELREAQILKPDMGFQWVRSKVIKYFRGGVCFIKHTLFFWGGGGAQTDWSFSYDFSQISMTSVVWRRGRRKKRRPDSGRNSVIHGRISSPIRSSAIITENSVFEHTHPLKKINIFDRTHWSHILGFKIWASLSHDWSKTKRSDGPF